MSCAIRHEQSAELLCSFATNGGKIKALTVYFSSDAGNEWTVSRCIPLGQLECTSYSPGFFTKQLNTSHLVTTLPKNFTKQSGYFRCQIPGLQTTDIKQCRWPSPDLLEASDSTKSVTTVSTPRPSASSSPVKPETENVGHGVTTRFTALLGVPLLLGLVIMIVCIVRWQKRKSKIQKGSWRQKSHKDEESQSLLQPGNQPVQKSRQFFNPVSVLDSSCDMKTQVSIPCISPRLLFKPWDDDVLVTKENYKQKMKLSLEQVYLVATALPRVLLSGPKGRGKTVVLLLKGMEWMRHGHDIYVVSTWQGSRAACSMLYHLLEAVNKRLIEAARCKLHLLLYDFNNNKHVDTALKVLSHAAAKTGSLHIIADEVDSEACKTFKAFCDNLHADFPRLYLWAAGYGFQEIFPGWVLKQIANPFECILYPKRDFKQKNAVIQQISDHVLDKKSSPQERRIYHRGLDHSVASIANCSTCGREVATLLHSLRAGIPVTNSASLRITRDDIKPFFLQWRDVLMLTSDKITNSSCLLEGLRNEGIPVQVMENDDIDNVATSRSDVIWVVNGDLVRGLERKVVVCLGDNDVIVQRRNMLLCTSLLLIITSTAKG